MIVRKIGNVTVYDDFKFSDSMNRVENLRIDLKQTFINQLIFAAMYIGISFFIMIFTVGYVHEITYLIIVLIALGIILRDWLKLKGKSRVIRGEYQKRRMVHFFRTSEVKDIAVYRNKSKLYVRMSNGIKEMLTPRTKDITIEHMNKAYQYIDEVIKERGYAPSVMDITKYLGYASKSSTHRILRMMEDEGMIILPKRNEGKIVIAKKDVKITKNGLEPNDKKV